MKSILPLLLFTFIFVNMSAQEKVSSIENFLLPEQVHQESSLSYIQYNAADYAMYIDLKELKLVDINDEDADVLTYQIQLECFDYSVGYEVLSNLENKIYLYSDATIQEINLDAPEETKLFSFETLSKPEIINIRNEYIVGYKRGINDISFEIIDLSDYSSHVYQYDEYARLKRMGNRLLIFPHSHDKIAEIDILTGDLEVLHEGGGIQTALNVDDAINELVIRDSSEYFFSYNFDTKLKDTICHYYGHKLDFGFINSKNNLYYRGQHSSSFEDWIFGINKEDCNNVETFKDFKYWSRTRTYSENGEDIIFLRSFNSVAIYNETTNEKFEHEIAFGNTPKSIMLDNYVYLLGKLPDDSGAIKLSRFDMLLGGHTETIYDIPGIGENFEMGFVDDNSLVIFNEVENRNSVIRLSLFNNDYEIRNLTVARDYGLLYNDRWTKHGTTISSNLQYPEYRLLSLHDEQLEEVDLPDFKIGYYQWDDRVAGMSIQNDDLYFRIFDQSTQSIIEETFISSFANKERYPMVKIGDAYFEIHSNRPYQRFPINQNFPLFDEGSIYEVVFQSESEIVVILQESQDVYSLARIGSNGIEIIYSDLPKMIYDDIDVWVDNGHRLILLFEDSQNKEVLLFSFDTQTGELLFDELYAGYFTTSHTDEAIDGWKTFKFDGDNDQDYIIATNGKSVKRFEFDDQGVDLVYNLVSHYVNGYLFFTDTDLRLNAMDEESLTIDISENIEGQYLFLEVMQIDDTYYFIGSDNNEVVVFASNSDFTEVEKLFATEINKCGKNWRHHYLGNDVNGEILITLNTRDYGNEIWYINPESKEVNLYNDINELPSSSVKSIEFLSEGNVYFKASDNTDIDQLYKIPVSFQPVNTTESSIKSNEVGLFPNPASNKLSLTIPLSSIVIKNISGLEVYKDSKNKTSSVLDVESLPSGIFILEGYDSDGLRYTEKFIKV